MVLLPHCTQTRYSDENSVRPPVRLSNVWIVTKRIKNGPDFYTILKIILPSFLRREWLVGTTSSIWNFGSTGPRWSEIADFEPIFARVPPQPYTPSEKVKLTIGSPLYAISSEPKIIIVTLPLNPPKGAQKRKTADFRLKSHFNWKSLPTLLQNFFVWKLSATLLQCIRWPN